MFVGGLPPDIDENEVVTPLRRYGNLIVDWPHKAESNGLLALSHACARCIRVAMGDEEGGKTWPWDNVPHPFRDWLEMRGKGKSHFLTAVAGDQTCTRALRA